MIYITDLGKIVVCSSCVALHCGKPIVYTDGFTIKRPVFFDMPTKTAAVSSSSSSSAPHEFRDLAAPSKQTTKIVMMHTEQKEKEEEQESTYSAPEITAVCKNAETNQEQCTKTNKVTEINCLHFTASITFDPKLQQPTFIITRSDLPEVKKYMCTRVANKAWKAALCDVIHDFPDRASEMAIAVNEDAVFTKGIMCYGLHLSEVSHAIEKLPNYSNLISLLKTNKTNTSEIQLEKEEEEEEEEQEEEERIQQQAASDVADNGSTNFIVVNSQTSTSSIHKNNMSATRKRQRTQSAEVSTTETKVTAKATRTRRKQDENGSIATNVNNKKAEVASRRRGKEKAAHESNLSVQPSLTLLCSVCGLANTPFCAVTGLAHSTFAKAIPCSKCGLDSAFCPVTGNAHPMSVEAYNEEPNNTNNTEIAATTTAMTQKEETASQKRKGRKRGEVHLPKTPSRNTHPRQRQGIVHKTKDVPINTNEQISSKRAQWRKNKANEQEQHRLSLLTPVTTSKDHRNDHTSTEKIESYIKDDDNDSSDDEIHSSHDKLLFPLFVNAKDDNNNAKDNKTNRKRLRQSAKKSTDDRSYALSRSTSRQSKPQSRSISLTPNKAIKHSQSKKEQESEEPLLNEMKQENEPNINIKGVTNDVISVKSSQNDSTRNTQEKVFTSADMTTNTTLYNNAEKEQSEINVDDNNNSNNTNNNNDLSPQSKARRDEMSLADLMLQEVYVYPPLKTPLPQSEQNKAATVLQQRWRAERGPVLLPPQHDILPLPMLTVRKNINASNSNNDSNSKVEQDNSIAAEMISKSMEPAKRGRRKVKTETVTENNNIAINESSNTHANSCADEKTNLEDNNSNSTVQEHNNNNNNMMKESIINNNTEESNTSVVEEQAATPTSPLSSVSSLKSNALLMYPLQINNVSTSVAGKRYFSFLWQYTSERTKQEALKSLTSINNNNSSNNNNTTVKDVNGEVSAEMKPRRGRQGKVNSNQPTLQLQYIKTEEETENSNVNVNMESKALPESEVAIAEKGNVNSVLSLTTNNSQIEVNKVNNTETIVVTQ